MESEVRALSPRPFYEQNPSRFHSVERTRAGHFDKPRGSITGVSPVSVNIHYVEPLQGSLKGSTEEL